MKELTPPRPDSSEPGGAAAAANRSGGGAAADRSGGAGAAAARPGRGAAADRSGGDGAAALPQGDVDLLQTEVAQRLLASSIPARYAYVARDGTPRVVASWFVWTGEDIVLPTFVAAPHARHSAFRLRDLRARPDVAITIDTNASPPEALAIRGRATIDEVQGIAPEYADGAYRYLEPDDAASLLAMLDDPRTRMARIVVRPAWVGVLDFRTRLPSALGGVQG